MRGDTGGRGAWTILLALGLVLGALLTPEAAAQCANPLNCSRPVGSGPGGNVTVILVVGEVRLAVSVELDNGSATATPGGSGKVTFELSSTPSASSSGLQRVSFAVADDIAGIVWDAPPSRELDFSPQSTQRVSFAFTVAPRALPGVVYLPVRADSAGDSQEGMLPLHVAALDRAGIAADTDRAGLLELPVIGALGVGIIVGGVGGRLLERRRSRP